MSIVVIAAGALSLALALPRLVVGPTIQDRMLALRSLLVRAALVCGAVAVVSNQREAADAAIIIVLAAFVFSVAVMKVFRTGNFQAPLSADNS
jgi:multisubunit Na+/H+ antiporter MnhF subunit